MAESHTISGLASMRGELAGKIDFHNSEIRRIKKDMATIDAAIKIFDPEFRIGSIKKKRVQAKNHFFKNGECNTLLMDLMREVARPQTTQEIVTEAAKRKGYDLDAIDSKAFTACLFTTIKRLQSKGIVREAGRQNNLIQWDLS